MTVSVYVEGWHESPEISEGAPDLNTTSTNFRALLSALGLHGHNENDGEIPYEDLARVSQKILRVIHNERTLKAHAVAPMQDRNFFYGELTGDMLQERLKAFWQIIAFAQSHHKGIFWA